MSKYIVCVDRAGLGNRLKGLVSAMRLSKILGRELLLYWENNQYLGCDFNDLFKNKFNQITKKELEEIKKKNSKVYRDILEEGHEGYDYLILDTWKFILLPKEVPENFNQTYSSTKGDNIDFEFKNIPLEIRRNLLDELFLLIPKKEIIERVDAIDSDYNLSNCIGLHIRRGDNKFTVDGREKISSDEKFIKIIESMPKEKFFLSTDGVETEEKFKKLFGERIICSIKGDRKRNYTESIKEAFIEVLLLSKTKHIFGSYLSTFSELAWWYSSCKSKIDIIGIGDVKKTLKPKTFFQKVFRKIKFYKVNFLRWLFKVYR